MATTTDTPQDLRTFVDYKESIIANCIDSGARTKEAKAIYETSRRIAREIVGDDTPEDRIRQRCVVSTGDPQFKDLMRFCHCLLYTSDAADEEDSVDLGGRRI